jgi:hypothetical protein
MKKLLYLIVLFIVLLGCNFSNDKNAQRQGYDTTETVKLLNSQAVVDIFNNEEKMALDSVARYHLQAIHDSCLKYLYIIYCDELLSDTSFNTKLTIGECSIRLTGFKSESDSIKILNYGVFVNDSLPTVPALNTSIGQMINGFEIDPKKRTIRRAKIGEIGSIEIGNVRQLCDSASKSENFKRYLDNHHKDLHFKLTKILKELS